MDKEANFKGNAMKAHLEKYQIALEYDSKGNHRANGVAELNGTTREVNRRMNIIGPRQKEKLAQPTEDS